jgi:hypothetical protein
MLPHHNLEGPHLLSLMKQIARTPWMKRGGNRAYSLTYLTRELTAITVIRKKSGIQIDPQECALQTTL